MKRIIILISCAIDTWVTAQIVPPPTIQRSNTTSRGLTVNSRKGTLIEKKIINLGKFKNLNIQKIVTKDISDNSSDTFLGIMYEYETFDEIFKNFGREAKASRCIFAIDNHRIELVLNFERR